MLISAAAGAVGSLAVQLARLLGASRVIGVAGGPEKCAYVTDELGADDALDYKQPDLAKRLRAIAPDGIDVYFDNVGGETLDAALGSLRLYGRIAICGMISQYNATSAPAGPKNLVRLIQTRGHDPRPARARPRPPARQIRRAGRRLAHARRDPLHRDGRRRPGDDAAGVHRPASAAATPARCSSSSAR